MSLSSAEAELYALTIGTGEGMVTRHLLKELGYEVTLVNHVDSQPAQARASERGLRRMKRAHVRAREKKQTTLVHVNTKSHKADSRTQCHTYEARMKGCAMLGLKLCRDDGNLV